MVLAHFVMTASHFTFPFTKALFPGGLRLKEIFPLFFLYRDRKDFTPILMTFRMLQL